MNIQTDRQHIIFKKEGQYGPMYSMGLSKKNQNGEYEKGYIPVKFRKDVELDNKTNIYIQKAWLTFYVDKDKKTIPYIFIDEFKKIEQVINENKTETKNDPFQEFANEVTVEEMNLPF